MQAMSMKCDGCGQRIEDLANPVMAVLYTGFAPLHPLGTGREEIGLEQFDMPQELRDLFDNSHYQSPQRVELCAKCFGIIFRTKMVSAKEDKNFSDIKAGALIKNLGRPRRATAGRVPLPAHLHDLKEKDLRERFPSLRPQMIPPDQLPQDTKPTTKRRSKKATQEAAIDGTEVP